VLERGDLAIVVNFGDAAASVPVDRTVVLFASPGGAVVEDGVVHLPRHAGALLARR
jgi:hypothetical protein